MSNFGTVLAGTVGGVVSAAAAFYCISIRQAFGGVTPIDQNKSWQLKSEDTMLEGKWVCSRLPGFVACGGPARRRCGQVSSDLPLVRLGDVLALLFCVRSVSVLGKAAASGHAPFCGL